MPISRTAPSRGSYPTSRRCPTSRPSSRPSRTTATSFSRTSATSRRSRARGRFRARPVSSTGSAGSRRPTSPATCHDPDNHDLMVRLRAQKVAGIAADIPELEVDDPDGAKTLVLSWGGTYGSVAAAVRRVRGAGKTVAHAHLRYLNPFPRNTGEVLRGYDKVLVPEINLGQLQKLVRAEFLVDAIGFNLVRGIPFRAGELAEAIDAK